MHVKICGIRSIEHLLIAATVGADMVGLVFAPSRRQVDITQAQQLVQGLRSAGYQTQVVGLFVDAPAADILQAVETCGLDVVQLHGYESIAILSELRQLPIIKAVRLQGDATEQAWLDTADPRVTLLVDAPPHANQYGGTGQQADWSQAATLAQTRRIMLAGGLTPTNVAEAIRTVRPWGVDVSSGVERDGLKDNGRIAAFVHLAKDEQGE